jgi:hypothetical protein
MFGLDFEGASDHFAPVRVNSTLKRSSWHLGRILEIHEFRSAPRFYATAPSNQSGQSCADF